MERNFAKPGQTSDEFIDDLSEYLNTSSTSIHRYYDRSHTPTKNQETSKIIHQTLLNTESSKFILYIFNYKS